MAGTQGLTAQLAEFVSGAQALALDANVLRTVRVGFADTVAVMLAGRDAPVTQVMRRFVEARRSSAADARLLLGPQRAAARDAALVNATAGHALDYDDVALQGHPSVVLVPALLAEGERLQAGGMAVLRAYVAGYEVWAELLARDQDLHHLKGWHPTGVCGTVAAAAAVAALRGLDAGRTRHALGLAASMASGLIANFGSMAKPFHAGNASAHGIDAVELAAAGMTAAPDTLEHHAGYLAALSPAGRVDRSPRPDAPGQHPLRIESLGLTVKKYPMCFATHRVIDAALDLARANDISLAQVQSVQATIGVAQAAMLRNHAPTDSLEAKFSLEFSVAAALAARKVGLSELDDAFVRRPDVQALFPRVRIATTDTFCVAEPTLAASDRLVITTHDGRQFDSGEVAIARGDPSSPLTDAELEAKFMDCAAGIEPATRQRLFSQLQRLEHLPSVADIA
jgi:2-methylcitrate dehydratase PrpD